MCHMNLGLKLFLDVTLHRMPKWNCMELICSCKGKSQCIKIQICVGVQGLMPYGINLSDQSILWISSAFILDLRHLLLDLLCQEDPESIWGNIDFQAIVSTGIGLMRFPFIKYKMGNLTCVSVSLPLKTSVIIAIRILVCRYILTIYMSHLSTKAIGSRSRSNE